jgi:hypothetical protein
MAVLSSTGDGKDRPQFRTGVSGSRWSRVIHSGLSRPPARRLSRAHDAFQHLTLKPIARLGRVLISPYPESDRGKLDEGEVIGGELVITGGNTPTLFDLVKEPLDQVT